MQPQEYGIADFQSRTGKSFVQMREEFNWSIPERYNIATALCGLYTDNEKIALKFENLNGRISEYSFADLDQLSTQLAAWLANNDVGRKDRVVISLEHRPETLISHLAVYKLGAVAVPLSPRLLGAERISYRINTLDPTAIITREQFSERLGRTIDTLDPVVTLENSEIGTSYQEILESRSEEFSTKKTAPTDPALILFTSGTSGKPKPVVHGHRCLAASIPCFEIANEFPSEDSVFFTPESWSWVVGTLNSTFPAWRGDHTVVGFETSYFDPQRIFRILEERSVTHLLVSPTTLRILAQEVEEPTERYNLSLEVIVLTGEPSTQDLFDWVAQEFADVSLNELYGQSELDMVLTNSSAMSPKEGALGKPVPGHQVAIIDDTGQEVPTGDIGKIAIKKPDPGMMLEYLSQKRSIEDKFIGDWLDTGDIGFQDRDGHFWFVGRADNRATAEGSRIPLRQVKLLIEQHQDVEAVLVARTPPKDLKASEGDEVITAVVHPSESTEQFQRLESEIYTLMMSFFENHTLSEGTNHIPRVLTNESAVSSMNQSELT